MTAMVIHEHFPHVFLFAAFLCAILFLRRSILPWLRRCLRRPRGYEALAQEGQELVRADQFSASASSDLQGGRPLSISSINWSNKLTFKLNGKEMVIVNPDPSELLTHFVRERMALKGTKMGCEEGGCGACSVMIQSADGRVLSANSCLRLLCLNDGMSITTIEGVGSVKDGLSPEQQSLVSHSGTQCGFCSPGWVMAMHALQTRAEREGSPMTMSDVDKKLDGNLCRCTGYRPIMKAFHSLCADDGHCTSQQDIDRCRSSFPDMEDIRGCPNKQLAASQYPSGHGSRLAASSRRSSPLSPPPLPQPLHFSNPATGSKYYRPVSLPQLCAVLRAYPRNLVQLVGGNTSTGVTKYLNGSSPLYQPDSYPVRVDINHVPELRQIQYTPSTQELVLGAAVTISEAIDALQRFAPRSPSASASASGSTSVVNHHSVFSVFANHLHHIANTQVRNAATWAGNLMLFLQYRHFPSDGVLAAVTAKAVLQLCDTITGQMQTLTMVDFLSCSYETFLAKGWVIVSLRVQEEPEEQGVQTVIETFKIARRERNAHALVDAGMHFRIRRDARGIPTCLSARIVFGAIAPQIFVANRTEASLLSQPLTQYTLQCALQAFQQDWTLAGGVHHELTSYAFVTSAAPACLYRFFLRCYPASLLPASLVSALLPWTKPPSHGIQVFPVNRDDNPLNPVGQAVRKLEAPIQTTGEAVYPSDEALPPNGLHGALVFTSVAGATLVAIQIQEAMKLPGVVDVVTAQDIPGSNETGTGIPLLLPVGSTIHSAGAPVACVLATSEEVALQALSLVKLVYGPCPRPVIIGLAQAIEQQSFYPSPDPSISRIEVGDAPTAVQNAPYRARGRVAPAGQSHFYMETHVAVARLVDGDRMHVVCGTQMPSDNQDKIAAALNVHSNQVTVSCQRVGGAFGAKLTGAVVNAATAAIAANKLRRPVRIFNYRSTDMQLQGGREEWIADYDVGYTADGVITGLVNNYYLDAGAACNDVVGALFMGMYWADNAYYFPNYLANGAMCQTYTPPRTAMRAPGVVQACLITEMILDRIASELRLPLHVVQERNFISNGQMSICGQVIENCTLSTVWSKAMSQSHFSQRWQEINAFNQANMWTKRGIACTPVKFGMGWAGYNAGVKIGVHRSDGYVTVVHSGIEIGQGINTKVAQAVAYALGIDIQYIRVERTSTACINNGGPTGGSGTSEVTVQAALNACKELNVRLDPYRLQSYASHRDKNQPRTAMPYADWANLIATLPPTVNLNAEGWFSPAENPNQQFFQYFVYAACVTEVKLNVLTGEVHVLRSELVYDCGQALNPLVDIGQIEGALVQGLGYFFHEKVVYDQSTGSLQTVGSWEYKPPMAQDIPSAFNVTLIADAYNTSGILGSKAVGEPPYVLANSAYFACKMAIASARADAGEKGYFYLPVPCTVDDRQVACLMSPQRYALPC